MAWSIEKVRPRIEVRRKRPKLVRYEWSCFFSSYGAASGTARTRKRAEAALLSTQGEFFASDHNERPCPNCGATEDQSQVIRTKTWWKCGRCGSRWRYEYKAGRFVGIRVKQLG